MDLPDKPYYTSSEAMKMVLQPDIPLRVTRQAPPQPFHATIRSKTFSSSSHPQYEHLLRPSAVKRLVHNARFEPLAPSPPPPLRMFYRESGTQTSAAVRRPLGRQTRSASLGRRSVRRWTQLELQPASMPAYNALTDPYLRQFYANKRRAQTNGSRSGSAARQVVYEVTVAIADRKNAGTTANLCLRINGGRTNVPKQKLTCSSGLVRTEKGRRYQFVPASENVFKLKGPNIEKIKSVVIECDCLEERDGVCIDEVEVVNLRTQQVWRFPCYDWLSLYESDCQVSRELFPESETSHHDATEYEVKTVTGGRHGAGTDANVFVTLYGKKTSTPRLHLHGGDKADPFERGQTDAFTLRTRDVDPLHRLRIEHDNTGAASGWFLERVTVKNLRSKAVYEFNCGQWLAKGEGDGRTCRDLFASGPKHANGGSAGQLPYTVSVFTGDKRHAGTNANVFMTLFGENGDSGELQLRGAGNLFERGQANHFTYNLADLGTLNLLRIRHDNSGLAAGWFLVKILVKNGGLYEFPCKRWLAKDEDDGRLSRDLLPAHVDAALTPYTLQLRTSDVRHAGTDARVFVQLHGGDGAPDADRSSGRVWLDGGKFSRGRTDRFDVEVAGAFSPLAALSVGHDNAGVGAGWHLAEAVVFCPVSGVEQHFLCDRWFATDEDDGLIERQLQEAKHLRVKKEKQTPWDVSVHTSDRRGAGTDANVYMTVYGTKGKSELLWLEGESDKFERGQTDAFVVETADIGTPTKVRVGHDNANPAAGWHLQSVDMTNRLTGDEYTFACDRWLAVDEDDGDTFRELPATGAKVRKPYKVLKYSVDVKTGGKMGAGTDADVHLCLFGKKGDTGNRPLTKSTNHRNKFERNQTDTFSVEAVDLGQLEILKIGHNGKGVGAGWFLDSVVVRCDENSSSATFPCGRWLAVDEDDGKIERELTPNSKHDQNGTSTQNLLGTTTYRLSVTTGDKRNAGTDSNVFAQIFGSNGDSGEVALRNPETTSKPFQRGRTDIFSIESDDFGKVKKMRIGHDGKGLGSGWFLQAAELQIPERGETYGFPCDRWIAADEEDGQLAVELYPSRIESTDKLIAYEVTVHTGDVRHGGTDANVSLQLYGNKGKTQIFQLRNSSNNFERGATDIFKLDGSDVGRVAKIRVETDGKGMGSGWFLDSIRVRKRVSAPTNARRSSRRPASGARRSDWRKDSFRRAADSDDSDASRRRTSSDENASVSDEVFSDDSRQRRRRVANRGRSSRLSMSNAGRPPPPASRDSRVNKDDLRRRSSRLSISAQSKRRSPSDDEESDGSASKGRRRHRRTRPQSSTSRQKQPSRSRVHSDDSADTSDEKAHLETYWFVCRRWFARSEDDGQLVRELLPTDKDGKPLAKNKASSCEYDVSVYTGNVSGAGTDANVFLTLFGRSGDSGERQLNDSATNRNKFERNCHDVFTVEAVELGQLEKVKVRHDNSGLGAAWFLDRIEVLEKASGKKYAFPCEDWLSTKKGDGNICRELVAISEKQIQRRDTTGSLKDKFDLELSEKSKKYHVSVKTGNEKGAGTDANVFIELHGKRGDTGKVPLKSSKTNKDKFEAGRTDEFVVDAVDIGPLDEITIGHDNTGFGADWYVEAVDVECGALGERWHFPCAQWLADGRGDGRLERTLRADVAASERVDKRVPYELTVHTSDLRNAGTDADVFVALFGADGRRTRQTPLCERRGDRRAHFNRGSVDRFVVELEDVGDELNKLVVGHDSRRWGDGWHLDKMEVRRLLDDGGGSVLHSFPCGRWLAADEEDGSTVRDLLPDTAVAITHARDGTERRQSLRRRSSLHMKRYKVSVFTGDVWKAGTDANVFLTVFGEFGDTGKRQLKESETHRDKFERNHLDVFSMELADLGRLSKIMIEHDNSALLGSDWFLDRVEILEPETNETSVFKCGKWLAKEKDGGQLQRTIFAEGYDEHEEVKSNSSRVEKQSSRRRSSAKKSGERRPSERVDTFVVTTTTASQQSAGTEAPAWLRLIGERGSSDKAYFVDEDDYAAVFEKAAVQDFSMQFNDVGRINKVEIGVDSSTADDAWFLKEIEIRRDGERNWTKVRPNAWIGGDGCRSAVYTPDDDSQPSRSRSQSVAAEQKQERTYDVAIKTSATGNAGTECDCWLQLFGADGQTDMTHLANDNDFFKSGSTDEFQVRWQAVGEPRKLRIGIEAPQQGRVRNDSWLVEAVELTDSKSGKTFAFPCGQWLALKEDKDGVRKRQRDLVAVTAKGAPVLPDTSYTVSVQTSDVSGAGTDANVSCVLVGAAGDSGQLDLAASDTYRDKFERGHTDVFRFDRMPALGPLSRVRIWHDSKGLKDSSWHLQSVEVYDSRADQTFFFPCDQWLSLKKGDKQICRELTCSSRDADKPAEENSGLRISVTTGDKRDAESEHDAWIVIRGDRGVSDKLWLQNSSRRPTLQRGQKSTFDFFDQQVGRIRTLLVGIQPKKGVPFTQGPSDDRQNAWLCDHLTIEHGPTGKCYEFPCKEWITVSRDEGDAVELTYATKESLQTEPQNGESGVVQYELSVVTGDERAAGTDANVFATLFGANGNSGRRALKQRFRNLFERAQTDLFVIESAELGPLRKLTIEHDDTGFGAGWLLDHVRVRHLTTDQVTTFPCAQWLDRKKADGRIARVLVPQIK